MAEKKAEPVAVVVDLVAVVAVHSITHGKAGDTAAPGTTLRVSSAEATWLIAQGAAMPVLTADEGL